MAPPPNCTPWLFTDLLAGAVDDGDAGRFKPVLLGLTLTTTEEASITLALLEELIFSGTFEELPLLLLLLL